MVGTVDLGGGPEFAVADGKGSFMSNGRRERSVYREDRKDNYSLVETVTTNPGSKTMALDTKTHNLLVPANLNGQFTVLVFGR